MTKLSGVALTCIALYTSSAVLTCHWSSSATSSAPSANSGGPRRDGDSLIVSSALGRPLSSNDTKEQAAEESSLFWDRQLEVSGSVSGSYGGRTKPGDKHIGSRDRWAKFKVAAKSCMAEKGKCRHWRGSRWGTPVCSADGTIDECVINRVTAGMLLLSDAYTCGECVVGWVA